MIELPDLKLSNFVEVSDLREFWEDVSIQEALKEGLDEGSYDKIYTVLVSCFPDNTLSAADESVVFKTGEILLDLYDCETEESLKEYLVDLIEFVQGQKNTYNKQLAQLSRKINLSTYKVRIGHQKAYPTKEDRIADQYSSECIKQVLNDLDLTSEYHNYKYGWRYEKQRTFDWLAALAHKTLLLWQD